MGRKAKTMEAITVRGASPLTVRGVSPHEANENEKTAQMLPTGGPTAVTAGYDSPGEASADESKTESKPGLSLAALNKEVNLALSRQGSPKSPNRESGFSPKSDAFSSNS